MTVSVPETPVDESPIDYPDSDGEPMADNTLQFQWIVTIEGGLDALFQSNPNVFVAGDLLWYPQPGSLTRLAPDALVAFGRPKGYRGSYKQWEEGGIAPQVVFEVLSPSNTGPEMDGKRAWYERYGVEEYYEYDPDRGRLRGWVRAEGALREVVPMEGFVSPRLGVRFGLEGRDLALVGPDGRRFGSYVEVARGRAEAEERAVEAEARAAAEGLRAAEQSRGRAEAEARAEAERLRAEEQARGRAEAEARALAERERAERLAERLRELGLADL